MKNNPIVNLFKYAWKYSFDKKSYLIVTIILTVFANLIALSEPLVINHIFNSIQFFEGSSQFLRNIILSLFFLVLIELGFWIFHGISRLIERKSAFLIRKNYKKEMFNKVLELPAAWHKDHHSGDTIDKINKSSEALFDFSETKFRIIESLTRLIGSAGVLLFFDWKSSLIAFAITVMVIAFISFLDRKLAKGYKKIFKWENFLASAIHDYVTNIFTIITLRLKKRVTCEIETRSMKAYPEFIKNSKLNEFKWFSTGMFIAIMTSGVLILNAYQTYSTSGVIVIGTLFVLYRYLREVGETFYNFAWFYGELVRKNAALVSAEIINAEYEKIVSYPKDTLPKNWKEISINGLKFSYSLEEAQETKRGKIEDISLRIKRGNKIALIGESGSGKSTILYLLRGLYKPKKVRVKVDSVDFLQKLSVIQDEVTLIPQEPEIFNSTIEDNITMGVNSRKEDIEKAIDVAQFRSVLRRLTKGMKTDISEKGVNLSGGEKQRLALARGILAGKESSFIFLDEPTSSVDSLNEKEIYNNIFSVFAEKTVISSVHRLHLLPKFDYIYYFKEGRIIAEGSMADLLKNEKFQALWKNYHSESGKRFDTNNL